MATESSQLGPSSKAKLEDGGPMEGGQESASDAKWLGIATHIDQDSTDWFDRSVRREVEKSIAIYNSKHPAGSKFHSDAYAKRSKTFRPRPRAAARKQEAALAVALFSTEDVVSVSALNKNDKVHAKAARIKESLLRRYLNGPDSINWLLTAMGLFQSAETEKVAISHQYWHHEVDQEGNVIYDRPYCDPIPIENFGISPSSDWRDPINSSPYTIHRKPMYVYQIKARMKSNKAESLYGLVYRDLSDEVLKSGVSQNWDSIRQRREGNRTDRYEHTTEISDFSVVWVYCYIVHKDGQDFCFDTIGTQHMLSDVLPIEEVYPHASTRRRPYVMGSSVIEAFKIYPTSSMELISASSEEINDLSNICTDNTKLRTNQRHFVRRGGATDITTLLRSVPGSLIYTNDPTKDVKPEQVQDLPRSIFEERNRLSEEMDDLLGTMPGSSTGLSRNRDQTARGLNLISENNNQIIELTLRSFVETTIEPILSQFMHMIEIFVSDEFIMAEAGSQNNASLNEVYDALFVRTHTKVNVGFGHINPVMRMARITDATNLAISLMPDLAQQANRGELIAEIFGAAGYQDGARFFTGISDDETVDPQVAQLQQKLQEMQAMIQSEQLKFDSMMQIEQVRAQSRLQIEQINSQGRMTEFQAKMALDQYREEQKAVMQSFDQRLAAAKNERETRELRQQREALSHSISMAERQFIKELIAQFGVATLEEAASRPSKLIETKQSGANEFEGVPGTARDLISSLRRPGSDGPVNLAGQDKAGIIARGDFGMVPFRAG